MKIIHSLMVILALKAAVFLLSIWTTIAETVHYKKNCIYFTTAFLEFEVILQTNGHLFE